MNSGNLSRHIACKLCRDRKVRCDGAQPSCEKCRRSGETCIYVPTHKPTKADLAQTIESLQERLDKAEAYILKHSNTGTGSHPGHADAPPLAATPNSTTIGLDYLDCSPYNMHMPGPGMSTPGDHHQFMTPPSGMHQPMPPTPFSHHSLPLSPETMDSDFMNYLRSQHQHSRHLSMEEHHLSQFPSSMGSQQRQMDEMSVVSGAPPGSSYRRGSVYSHRQQPSLRDVRIMTGSSTSNSPPPPSPGSRGPRPDDANHILAELTAFGMVVFNTQAEIAGISSVVAEYMEWMRKTPSAAAASSGGGAGSASPTENPVVLETLETRLRELNALANARHAEAWRQSVVRLERLSGVGAMLNLFDSEMQRRSAETAEFFRTNYNIFAPLPEQQSARKGDIS